ncbi:DUF4767 domain-containing protein [Weissella hellenica]|uniref:DUF4767 domain-containing protein n=1 Tax=Weissella hellenica TaxID=46256 RepID=A0A4Y4G2N1_WEIHE|nr:DUF4767 domain-containing protein [Weissella hellenica]NKY66765.1 DUF4767 domain-containing protein [Weissella hellenica]GED35973.1 hypothetical protein WHE01_08770 [Weissella hellenica]SCB86166.1 Short C-terminal domain-containing protein [Weissella hellenica]
MGSTDLEKLNKLKKMLDEGIITSDEFSEMKQVIIQDSKSVQQETRAKSRKQRGWVLPVVVAAAVVLIGVVGGYFGATYISQRNADQEVSQSSHRSLQKKIDSVQKEVTESSEVSSDQPQSSSSSEAATVSGWNATKQAELSSFMAQWQAKMHQQYQGTYDSQSVEHLGIKFPEQIQNGELQGRIELNGAITNVVWDADGKTPGDYQAVAVASGTIPGQMYPTTYLFMLNHGQPIVYMTKTTNGNILSFTPTANTELQAGFENVVND